jgi:hypothetical protein
MLPGLHRSKRQVEVIALARPWGSVNWLWYGLFYFFSLFFGHTVWRVLVGG